MGVWTTGRRAVAGVSAALLLVGCTGTDRTSGDTASQTSIPAAGPAPGAGTAVPPARWVPSPGTTWQWQLTGPLDLSVDAAVYDVDGLTTTAEQVAALHAAGRRAVCYLSVGTWESFRPDADAFPPALRGRPLEDFPDERWLDVRRLDLLAAPLRARLDTCRDKGFDAVEPDDVDGFANDSGFPLRPEDGLRLVRWVADEAHARGMSAALKNDLDQVPQLVDDVDLAVVEQCREYDECDALAPFVAAGKAVLHVEYDPAACRGPALPGFSSLLKDVDLDARRAPCGS